MPVEAPRSGKESDLRGQLQDLRKRLNDPDISRAEKERLYDHRLRIENALSRVSAPGGFDSNDYGVSPDIINQINDQDVPIGQPVDFDQIQKAKEQEAKEKKPDPDKYKEQGGPALEAKDKDKEKKKGLFDRFKRGGKEEAGDKLKDKAKDKATGGVKEGVSKGLQEGAKKLASQALNLAKKAIVQLASKNPVVLIIAGAIILVAILGLIIWGVVAGQGSTSPNPNGTTYVQAADPLKDAPLINKILSKAGEAVISPKDIEQLIKEIESVKQYADADTQKKIEGVIPELRRFSGDNKQLGPDIIKKLYDILKSINPCAEVGGSPFFKFVDIGNGENESTRAELINKGKLTNRAGTEVTPAMSMCRFLVLLENNKTQIGISDIQITALARHRIEHYTDASGKYNLSHADGHAVDIDWRNNGDTKIMKWVFENYDSLKAQGIALYTMKEPLTQYEIARGGEKKGEDALNYFIGQHKGDTTNMEQHGWRRDGSIGGRSHIHLEFLY